MFAAINNVENGISGNKAADGSGVPHSTFFGYYDKRRWVICCVVVESDL